MHWFSRKPFRAVCSLIAAVALAPAVAPAQVQQGPQTTIQENPHTGPYQLFWAAVALIPSNGEPYTDWVANTTFGDYPIRRDITVLYQSDGGLYPYGGIQQVESDPDWMRRHFLKLQHAINWFIPDPNQGGYGVIDYESWEACWSLLTNYPSNQGPDARDLDFKDDWRDYIRQRRGDLLAGRAQPQQEAIFESTYNDAVRRFFVATINECKRLRPNMKWGYYLFPPRTYFGAFTDEARSLWAAKHRPYLGWLYEAQDVFFPDIYSLYYTVADRQADMYRQEDPLWQFEEYVRWTITDAVACANGKPVIAFVYLRYHENARAYVGQLLNDVNLEKSFSMPRQYGAHGVALWEAIDTTQRFNENQQYVTNKVVPYARLHFTDAAGNALTTAEPNTGSGSNGSEEPPSPQPPQNNVAQGPGNGGTTPPEDDPLRTRPYVNVHADDDGPTDDNTPSQPSQQASNDDNSQPPEVRPTLNRRGTINVPSNVRAGRSSNRNPSWPAIVRRNVAVPEGN